jgi:acetyl-CoA acetyltransferase
MAADKSGAVIIAAARTAIGTARRGTLANMSSRELAEPVVAAAIRRSGLDATNFDDLILAEVMQGGGDTARYVAVELGLDVLPGQALNRQCASSLAAISVGAGQIAAGMSRAILAGGAEFCSGTPHRRASASRGHDRNVGGAKGPAPGDREFRGHRRQLLRANDAAAVVALSAPDPRHEALAHVLAWTSVGVPPNCTGSAPISAIPKVLELAGRKLRDITLFEINEAFAARSPSRAPGS